mmetsp:Transcript_27455/g.62142  ORF Transcript_27455/g.62142 Transcript_27455/m.62142 type:complete len:202 (+) Transcript_27455:418-1023(+)
MIVRLSIRTLYILRPASLDSKQCTKQSLPVSISRPKFLALARVGNRSNLRFTTATLLNSANVRTSQSAQLARSRACSEVTDGLVRRNDTATPRTARLTCVTTSSANSNANPILRTTADKTLYVAVRPPNSRAATSCCANLSTAPPQNEIATEYTNNDVTTLIHHAVRLHTKTTASNVFNSDKAKHKDEATNVQTETMVNPT